MSLSTAALAQDPAPPPEDEPAEAPPAEPAPEGTAPADAPVEAPPAEAAPVEAAPALEGEVQAGLEAGPDLDINDGVDEVVVTVDRREKNLQKYSGTASAFSQSELSSVGITNVRELSSMVPGLQIGVQEGNTEVFIRGIGSDNNTELGDPAVALHIDGIYIPRPRGVGSMFFDLERVEVNSGPQGTLRGRNAMGGSLNIVTAKPQLGEFGANAEATFGTFATRRFQGMVNIPIGDLLAFRFAGFSEVHDPYFINAGPIYDIPAAESADTYAFRGQARFQPSQAFSALVGYDFTRERGTGYLGANFQDPLTAEDDNDTPDGADDIPTPIDPADIDNPRRVYYRGMNPAVDLKHHGVRAELNYDTGPVIIQAVGSYRDLIYNQRIGGNAGVVWDDPDGDGPQPGYDYPTAEEADDFDSTYWRSTSQSVIAELRLFAPDTARFRWTVGGFFFDEDQNVFLGQTNDPANGFGGVEFNMPDTKGGSLAGYADATFDVDESFRVLGGLRVTHEDKSRKGGLGAIWGGIPTLGRFGTEGFRYQAQNRSVFALPDNATAQDRVDAFLDGIASFGARDELPQNLCNDPPAAAMGDEQQPRIAINPMTNRFECTAGVRPEVLNPPPPPPNADGTQDPAPPGFNVGITPQNDETSMTYLDWRVGAELDLDTTSMLYATVSTGHKTGGFNDTFIDSVSGLPTNPPQYDPESVMAFELGSKNMLADRRLRLNASAFFYRYSDMVFQQVIQVTADPNLENDDDESAESAVRQNATSANIFGLDLDVVYSLPVGLEAQVHVLAMDARFGDGVIVQDGRIGFGTNYPVDIGGNWLPRASPLTINYSLSQLIPTAAGYFNWLISAQTRLQHFMTPFNGEGNLLPIAPGFDPPGEDNEAFSDLSRPNGAARLTDVVPTYTRFDLALGWKHPDSRISINGFVNNVTNIAYTTSINSSPNLNLRFFNPPRTAGVSVRVDW